MLRGVLSQEYLKDFVARLIPKDSENFHIVLEGLNAILKMDSEDEEMMRAIEKQSPKGSAEYDRAMAAMSMGAKATLNEFEKMVSTYLKAGGDPKEFINQFKKARKK